MKLDRKQIGNYIFILGLVLTLALNFNVYELYLKMERVNYLLIAATIGGTFLCYADFKEIFHDKKLWLVVLINIVTVINLFISRTGLLSVLNVFSISMIIYLSDKVVFSKRQMMVISAFLAFFFFYWTIDVKGYFKGYSINFGGLVLIAGFVCVIIIAEWIKYYLINKASGCKYPFYITFVEMILFGVAIKIMSWYRSRTAFFALIVFGLVLLIPKKLTAKKWVRYIMLGGSVLLMTVFPVLYCLAGKSGLFEFNSIFYKPVIGARTEIYSYLLGLLRTHPFAGNGTIYISGIEPFRNGFLDTCNGFLQIAVPHGLIIYVLMLVLAVWALKRKQTNWNPVSAAILAGIIAIIAASCSESMIAIPPFTVIVAALVFIYWSSLEEGAFEYVKDDTYSIYIDYIKADKGERIIPTFCVTLMLLFMYLILGPLEVFYSNYIELEYNAYDFGWFFVGITVLVLVVVPMVMGSLPKLVSKIYCTIALAIGLVSYIQYIFINGDLVDVNGNFTLPKELGARYYVSWIVTIVVIVAVVLVVILLEKHRNKIFIYTSIILTIIMAAAVVSVVINLLSMKNKPHEKYRFDAVHEFDYGSESNVIVIVLDTFGREALDEVMAEQSDVLDVFRDFTFYENEDSIYFPTFPSLIHMLTEHEHADDQGVEEYQREAFESDTSKAFFGELHNRGYNVSVYSNDLMAEDYMLPYVDNMTLSRVTVNKKDIRNKLFKMSIYRYVPYMIKPSFEVYNPKENNVGYDIAGEVNSNDAFMSRFKERGVAKSPECAKKFSFNHLYGVHVPYRNDEFGNMVAEDSVSKTVMCRGLIHILNEYFNALKEAGVYDEATIIITADHGEFGNTDAIFFKKESFESHDKVVISDELITHHDLQKIVLDSTR